jgi:SAM-dependent methyltransferase
MTNPLSSIIPPFLYNLKTDLKHRKFRNYNLRKELIEQISENPEINKLFPEKKLKKHFVYEPIRDTEENPDLLLTQLRFYWYYRYFKKNYPDIFEKDTTVLDVGGTSGIVIESLDKKGVVLNINQECIDLMKKAGIKAILGDAEDIDLKDKSYDYVTSFQCLEHIPNPLRVLNEMGRIARKKVFISIPFVKNTRIYNKEHWINIKKESWKVQGDVKKVDCHIFEFSTEDLKNLLSYTNLEYQDSSPIYYFDNKTSFRRYYNEYHGSYFNFFVFKHRKM